MYFLVVLSIHTALCITLIGLVLLQQGKGADAGATFGGGSSNSVFGAAGAADFITKLTTSLAVGFMITSILLIRAYSADGGRVLSTGPVDITEGSLMQQVAPPVEEVEDTAVAASDTEEGLTIDVEDSAPAADDASAEGGEAAAKAVVTDDAAEESGAASEAEAAETAESGEEAAAAAVEEGSKTEGN